MTLLALPILAQALSLTLSDRSEIRDRLDSVGQHFDLLTDGRISFQLASRLTNWEFAYSTSVTQIGVGEGSPTPLLFQALSGNATIRLAPRTSAFVGESATYGRQNFQLLAVGLQTPTGTTGSPGTSQSTTTASNGALLAGQVGARPATIRFGATSTTAGLTHTLARRWQTGATGVYSISGGLDDNSRQVIPRARSLNLSLSLFHTVTERDRLEFLGSDLTTQTSGTLIPGGTASIFDLEARWVRHFTPVMFGGFAFGGAYTKWDPDGGNELKATRPVAAASYGYTDMYKRGRVTITLEERYSPMVDRLSGTIDQRAITTLGVNYNRGDYTLLVTGYNIMSDPYLGQGLLTSYGASETVAYKLDRHWAFEAGMRQSYQSYGSNLATSFVWAIFVAASCTTTQISL